MIYENFTSSLVVKASPGQVIQFSYVAVQGLEHNHHSPQYYQVAKSVVTATREQKTTKIIRLIVVELQPPIIAVEFVFVTASQIELSKITQQSQALTSAALKRKDMVIVGDDECVLALSHSSLFSATFFRFLSID